MTATSFASGHPVYFDGTVWRFKDTNDVVNHERACSHCGLAPVLVKLCRPTAQRGLTEAGVDACIAPLVQALNDGGIQTVASCCGHGRMPGRVILEDGRDVLVMTRADSSEYFSHERFTIYGEERSPTRLNLALAMVKTHLKHAIDVKECTADTMIPGECLITIRLAVPRPLPQEPV